MKKRALSLALALALLVPLLPGTARASDFVRSRTYAGQFTDVDSGAWYAGAVKDCYELGLMNGSSDTTFNPAGLFTLAEVLTVAARMNSICNGGNGVIPASGGTWYQGAVDYCVSHGIIRSGQFDNYTRSATRAEMAGIIAAALPDSEWAAINGVTALPDVSDSTPYSDAIFVLYNAGVFTGSDEYGAFQPYAYITRAEVAAIAARCADASQRVVFSLTPMSQREAVEIPGFYYQTNSNHNSKISDGLIRVWDQNTQRYGYVNWRGEFLYDFCFNDASHFKDGVAWVESRDHKNNKLFTIINTKGEDILTLNNTYASSFQIIYSKVEYLGSGVFSASYTYYTDPNRYGTFTTKKSYDALIINGKLIDLFDDDGFPFTSTRYGSSFAAGIFSDAEGKMHCAVYDMSGTLVQHFTGSSFYIYKGSPLVAIKGTNKWSLVTVSGVITEQIYDEIRLVEDSSLALLRIGKQYALAGPNGIIFDIGEYEYYDIVTKSIMGDYAAVCDGETVYLADMTGILPGSAVDGGRFSNGYVWAVADHYVVIATYDKKYLYELDTHTVSTVSHSNELSNPGYQKGDGSGYTKEGIYYQSYEAMGYYYYVLQSPDGKYGLYGGPGGSINDIVGKMIYDTPEEAIAKTGKYEIQYPNGKPILVYGNELAGYTPVIEYYRNNLNYDRIWEIGGGYYACEYDATWYLVHP